jgi:hypothetical protein
MLLVLQLSLQLLSEHLIVDDKLPTMVNIVGLNMKPAPKMKASTPTTISIIHPGGTGFFYQHNQIESGQYKENPPKPVKMLKG